MGFLEYDMEDMERDAQSPSFRLLDGPFAPTAQYTFPLRVPSHCYHDFVSIMRGKAKWDKTAKHWLVDLRRVTREDKQYLKMLGLELR